MSKSDRVHPDEVLKSLLATSMHSERQRNLKLIHEICAAQAASSGDFSLKAIGRLSQVAGGLSARALYNSPSEVYRALIAAWADYVGAFGKDERGRKPDRLEEQLLRYVADPAVRSLVQQAFNERNKLRAELNLLKSVTCFHIDRRPPQIQAALQTAQRATPLLTASEREALERAVSSAFLADEGWTEGDSGQVRNERGRTLFQVGFTRAIRKVLAL